ncbi:MAG: polysaccharide deacetylase family protein [Deltaproteobacteria bacterium]|nr:polysaccharide deacetylase family protein [Deltaproteobacteria bacterium]
MYHRVLTDEEYSRNFCMGGISVKTRTFEKQMKFLADNFRILSPEEFLPRLQGRTPFETKSCLITFDDGWKDNFKNALPILAKNKISALIFLSSGFIDTSRRFWQDRVIASLSGLRKRKGDSSIKTEELYPEEEKERINKIIGCNENVFREEVSLFINPLKKKKINQIEELITLLNQGLEIKNGKKTEESAFFYF